MNIQTRQNGIVCKSCSEEGAFFRPPGSHPAPSFRIICHPPFGTDKGQTGVPKTGIIPRPNLGTRPVSRFRVVRLLRVRHFNVIFVLPLDCSRFLSLSAKNSAKTEKKGRFKIEFEALSQIILLFRKDQGPKTSIAITKITQAKVLFHTPRFRHACAEKAKEPTLVFRVVTCPIGQFSDRFTIYTPRFSRKPKPGVPTSELKYRRKLLL